MRRVCGNSCSTAFSGRGRPLHARRPLQLACRLRHQSMNGLYLCYFGLREPLVQTQVLPYLRELVAGGIGMSLLTFEPDLKRRWSDEAIAEWRSRLRSEGIEWHMLQYHKWPSLPATLFDVIAGAWRAAAIARREKIDLLHGRSHVGAAI